MSIRAIETVYKGYRFRSRSEARWAVFFDTLDIEWEYEKEGYELDGVRYLPDFWLPEQDCWVEIKGQRPSETEIDKVVRLAQGSRKTVYILYGSLEPFQQRTKDGKLTYCGAMGDMAEYQRGIQAVYYSDSFHFWAECPHCGRFGIAFWGSSNELWCAQNLSLEKYLNPIADLCDAHHTPRLIAAYTAARQARFEHGENPNSI